MDGMQLLSAVLEVDLTIPVVLVTGHGDIPLAVKAIRQGAYEFLEKPFSPDRLIGVVKRAMELRQLTLENRQIKAKLDADDPSGSYLVGRSAVMQVLGQKIRTISESEIDVLILGETGTGKELTSKLIHDLSERKNKPFVAVNLAALPEGTNVDLEAAVAEGKFRSDLYYRLAPVTIAVPPLRDRIDDAPRLFQHLVETAAKRFRRDPPDVPPDVLAALSRRSWPGNVREMRNVAERFVLGLGIDEIQELPNDKGLAEQAEQFEKATIAVFPTFTRVQSTFG